MKIGFVGLGKLGLPVALAVESKGHDVIGYDISLAKKKECKIKWNIPAKNLVAKINGLSPFPGAWFEHKKNRLKIIKAEEIDLNGKEGEIIDDNLIIGCLKNSIKILEIQKEGKKTLNTKDFLSGYKIKKGEKLT